MSHSHFLGPISRMANLKRNLALIVLCQLAGYVIGQQPPNLVSFGDFMEFDVGLHKACENAAGGPNTTWGIIVSYHSIYIIYLRFKQL